MKRAAVMAIVLLAGGWLAGCGDDSTITSEESTFTVVPATPVAESALGGGMTYTIVGDDTHPDKIIEYPWKTTFTINITETAGVGRDISAVSIKVQQASGGIVITPTGSDIEHYHYTSHASGNRIEAKGSASISFDVWYDLPNKGREALVTATFSFVDDNDASFSESKSVPVQ